MAYNNNAKRDILYPGAFYTLYIGPNYDGTGHLIFKLLTKQILTTPKYKPVPMLEDLIKTTNEMDTFTTKLQTNHFDSDHYTAQEDYFNNTQDDDQDHCDDMNNSEHESYNDLDSSQQIDTMKSDTRFHLENKILQSVELSISTNISIIKPTGVTIISTFLQNLFLQHFLKGFTMVLSLQPPLSVSLHDDILHLLYQGVSTVVSL